MRPADGTGTADGTATQVRSLSQDDVPAVCAVSRRCDTLFETVGIVLPPDDPEQTVRHADLAFVVGRPAVGFATMIAVDGRAHLEQLAVDPPSGRQGLGGRLLDAVCRQATDDGFAEITLTTFRDVAWNGPWYTRRGFVELPAERWGTRLTEIWQAEIAAGIHLAPRIAMIRRL